MKKKEVFPYKFSKTATEIPPFQINDPVEFLSKNFKSHMFGFDNLLTNGIYKYQGWIYDLKPFMQRFVYNIYGNW